MEVFPYSWNTYEENNCLGIRIFALNKKNESVFILITDFKPYIYLELPELPGNASWSDSVYKLNQASSLIDRVMGKSKPVKKMFQLKKKLYYAKKDLITKDNKKEYVDKLYPFLKCYFNTFTDLKNCYFRFKKPQKLSDLGDVTLKVHESDANPILQFMCMKNIKPSGWFKFAGTKITNDHEKLSNCQHEYETSWEKFVPIELNDVVKPLIMGFDIEVNSSNPNVAPQFGVPEDKVFQISCVFCRNGDDEKKYEKYILSLGKNKKGEQIDLIPTKVGEDIEIRMFDTEADLLLGFNEIINEKNPNVICGYNIFGFDIPYIYERTKLNYIDQEFTSQLSFIKDLKCERKEIKWDSSAFKNQHFVYLDAPGRLWVDMLPVIQRDYKLENYKLKTVSDTFLGQTKDPLTHKGIFKCYRMFTPESLSVVAKYCVKDSELVVKLFEKLQIWIGLVEMSNTCNTPIFTLFTQGQQIKIFSQVYKKCMYDNYVIDKDSFIVNENDNFTGAYVFTPKPGLYDMVVSFDFSSLYPSTIIAYNIDYTTLVLDEKIPDEMCNIFDWHDHCGCEHDKTIRNTKPKNIVCGHQRFRFLKEPPGVIPTLLKNLLDARKKTRKEMEKLKESLDDMKGDEKEAAQRIITVLDKRQLAFKVSANSMYGGMGVKRGYLPFLPGAMCTTARGRESIEKASKFLVENYGANLIYGDTDSCYISFPQYQSPNCARDLDSFCRQIEDETSNLFPKPMKFAYEEAIYWRYLILTKKRYMALKCDLNGNIKDKIEKRGVLLSRRDNSAFSRDMYSKIIMKTFYKENFENICYVIKDELDKLYSNSVISKDLSISKSVGDIKDYKIKALPLPDPICVLCQTKNEKQTIYCDSCIVNNQEKTKCVKCKKNEPFFIKNIKMSKDKNKEPTHCYDCKDEDMINVVHKKLQKRLEDLKIFDKDANLKIVLEIFNDFILSKEDFESYSYKNSLEYQIVMAYIDKALPSQVQLAQKMRKRGTFVAAGERIAYVVVQSENTKDKLFDKIEDLDYFKENSSYIKIDHLYYTKLMINPVNEILEAVYNKSKIMDKIYKYKQNYYKVIVQLNELFSPKINLS